MNGMQHPLRMNAACMASFPPGTSERTSECPKVPSMTNVQHRVAMRAAVEATGACAHQQHPPGACITPAAALHPFRNKRERQAPEHRYASRGHPLKSNARCCAELSWCASLAYVNDLSYRDVPNRVLQSVYTALLPPRSLLNDQRVPYPPHRFQ
jgi:hypothetical protein